MRFNEKTAPEPGFLGYWDADNLIRLFGGESGDGIAEHPPSEYLIGALRDMAARGVSDAQVYLDGFAQRMEEWANEGKGPWKELARRVAGQG